MIKNHIAKKGQKGIIVLNLVLRPFLILDDIISDTQIILHTRYVIIIQQKLNHVHNISHINIAILNLINLAMPLLI